MEIKIGKWEVNPVGRLSRLCPLFGKNGPLDFWNDRPKKKVSFHETSEIKLLSGAACLL